MMRHVLLERKPTTCTHTEGFIYLPNRTLCTIERPWVPVDEHKGGKPFESCVPDGVYLLRPHTRPNGQEVVTLINEDLHVFYTKEDMLNSGGRIGRYLILVHIGNWVEDVVGCIAPGLTRSQVQEAMVTHSGTAMARFMEFVSGHSAEIEIRTI